MIAGELPYRYQFRWRIPKAIIYRAAVKRHVSVKLNRYPGVVIGIGLQVGQRVLSIVWGRPGRAIEIDCLSRLRK